MSNVYIFIPVSFFRRGVKSMGLWSFILGKGWSGVETLPGHLSEKDSRKVLGDLARYKEIINSYYQDLTSIDAHPLPSDSESLLVDDDLKREIELKRYALFDAINYVNTLPDKVYDAIREQLLIFSTGKNECLQVQERIMIPMFWNHGSKRSVEWKGVPIEFYFVPISHLGVQYAHVIYCRETNYAQLLGIYENITIDRLTNSFPQTGRFLFDMDGALKQQSRFRRR